MRPHKQQSPDNNAALYTTEIRQSCGLLNSRVQTAVQPCIGEMQGLEAYQPFKASILNNNTARISFYTTHTLNKKTFLENVLEENIYCMSHKFLKLKY